MERNVDVRIVKLLNWLRSEIDSRHTTSTSGCKIQLSKQYLMLEDGEITKLTSEIANLNNPSKESVDRYLKDKGKVAIDLRELQRYIKHKKGSDVGIEVMEEFIEDMNVPRYEVYYRDKNTDHVFCLVKTESTGEVRLQRLREEKYREKDEYYRHLTVDEIVEDYPELFAPFAKRVGD